MPPILIILDILALFVGIFVLSVISRRFWKIFTLGAFIPLIIIAIITLILQPAAIGVKEAFFFMLRGGVVLAVFSGLLTCYLVSRRTTRDKKGD